ncbi:uncharacterized protein FIBRA_05716 [Fibroporia radiculosa]|uniref:sn-1-specific diacylglycerol lipase n=1 Tax=Fibroporia radiculosa TaxID=599839 RepID=J4H3P0_9APHY|nr:uncharacterized protein FIBRA_05716 [Fibroporia radiculosa]CCM03579.1 predicted protein [Fibroporia radiculosa]
MAGESEQPHGDANVHITTDVIYPHGGGQIVTADIGEAATPISTPAVVTPNISSQLAFDDHPCMSNAELKQTLRRFSKLVLAGYGGPSLLFFGVSPWSSSMSNKSLRKEEVKLTDAIGASEAEASSSRFQPSCDADDSTSEPGKPSYSWWNVMMGKHDRDIFLKFANSHPPQPTTDMPDSSRSNPLQQPSRPPTAYIGNENLMPRFWVLTDHARREVVLVIRGTMSLNELAVDLTCEPTPFELHTASRPRSRSKSKVRAAQETDSNKDEDDSWSEVEEELGCIPGSFPIDISTPAPTERSPRQVHLPPPTNATTPDRPDDLDGSIHLVHGGMLKMARAMGAPGKPVHTAVREALRRNREYSLVLCGHSLGAGVAALLSLMWADPNTRLTHRYSGLPQRRAVSAYCFAPPCLTSPRLASIAGKHGLVTSFVYGHDIVSRLSLGSMRDLSRCCSWLCQAEVAHGEGHSAVTKRALRWKAGYGKDGDEDWFLAIRKTLEANMHMTQLFPPGQVFWALRDGDLHPSHRLREANGSMRSNRGEEKVRLFHVLDVERAFSQIVFARDMLSAHMPHQYDRVVHELL